jgi:hypothetical protein
MTTEQLRIRLPKDEVNALRRIGEKCGISYTTLAGVFIKSALEATIRNQDRVPLPLELQIKAETVPVNEPRFKQAARR